MSGINVTKLALKPVNTRTVFGAGMILTVTCADAQQAEELSGAVGQVLRNEVKQGFDPNSFQVIFTNADALWLAHKVINSHVPNTMKEDDVLQIVAGLCRAGQGFQYSDVAEDKRHLISALARQDIETLRERISEIPWFVSDAPPRRKGPVIEV